jgi:MGT family glycosyltransferase
VWNFPGCIHPFLSVAKVLQERGHTVGFYTGSAYRGLVEREGFTFFPFQPEVERIVQEKVHSTDSIGANWHRPWKIPSLLKDFFVESIPLQVQDLEPVLRAWGPDAIVCDPAMFAPYLVLHERAGIPVAVQSYPLGCQISSPDVPAVGLGLPLPRGPLGRLRNAIAGRAMDLALAAFRSRANAFRRQYGLPPLRGPLIDRARDLPLYLVMSCPELDYPRRDPPANMHYVGPCFYYPPADDAPRLRDLRPDEPCVYVNEGTIHAAEPFILRAARDGLADMPIRVVMTTGRHRRPESLGLGALPANFLVEDWVSHDVLMPKLRAMVCTGGSGTVLAALRCGVPMAVVSTEWDHAENAQRLVEAGAGIRLHPRRLTAARMRRAVSDLLYEPSYRRNARRIADALGRCGGPARAAELLEAL